MHPHLPHSMPALILLAAAMAIQWKLNGWMGRPETPARRVLLAAGNVASALLVTVSFLLNFVRVSRFVPDDLTTWIQAAGLFWLMCLIALLLAGMFWKAPAQTPQRRAFLKTAGTAVCLAPLAGTAFGIVGRNRFRISEVDVPIPNLPKDLVGLRLVQVTDIHLSPFLEAREFARAVDMANESRAHIALVTGDLISRPGDPLQDCLRELARLRADAGVLGCLGNHEYYTDTEDLVTREGARLGIDFLRKRNKELRFGNATINFAGVDYQQRSAPYLEGAEKLVQPNKVNVLLSHNPDVFPVAAAKGYALTIAGHTHGGQVNVEILHRDVNIARYYTPYVHGLYRADAASVYVSRGIGTIGVPVRIGAPPEISVLRLCAS